MPSHDMIRDDMPSHEKVDYKNKMCCIPGRNASMRILSSHVVTATLRNKIGQTYQRIVVVTLVYRLLDHQ